MKMLDFLTKIRYSVIMWQTGNTISLLFAFIVNFDHSSGEKVKIVHFNKDREQIWKTPEDRIEENPSWVWDFDEFGNCLRFDIPPFKFPLKFTLCYRAFHDYKDVFHMMNLMSTKSGKSVIDELQSKP